MRILLSCLQSLKQHRIPACGFWRDYFVNGLSEAGHEVIEVANVDWAEALTYADGDEIQSWRDRTWNGVREFVRREHRRDPIHLFLSYLYPSQVDVAAVREIRRRGIPCVNFFCDNVREFSSVPQEYRVFDLHWVPEFEAQEMYQRAGMPFINLPMPCWIPTELRRLPCQETEPPVFIGSSDVLRCNLLAGALRRGADFYIRGAGWKAQPHSAAGHQQSRSPASIFMNQVQFVNRHGWRGLFHKIESRVFPLHPIRIAESRIGGALSNAEYTRFTREAVVTIGINRAPTAIRSLRRPAVYSRLRDIEAPMLGACYLTEWTLGLEHMYDLGAEVETYQTPEELCHKLSELRSNSSRRATMRQRAQRRALADHSVMRSLSRISDRLGLNDR